MKTYSLKPKDVSRKWHLLDASETTLGRLATQSARLLLGKDKPNTSHHIDNGDYVIVINADKLKVSGNKVTDKTYYRHSGYPGGLRKRSLNEQRELDSAKVIVKAISGMIPANKLKRGRLNRLKVYPANEHSHTGQNPVPVSLERKLK